MTPEEYCKLVDKKLTWWLDERMRDYTERQYGKGEIRELRDQNPLRQGAVQEPETDDYDNSV